MLPKRWKREDVLELFPDRRAKYLNTAVFLSILAFLFALMIFSSPLQRFLWLILSWGFLVYFLTIDVVFSPRAGLQRWEIDFEKSLMIEKFCNEMNVSSQTIIHFSNIYHSAIINDFCGYGIYTFRFSVSGQGLVTIGPMAFSEFLLQKLLDAISKERDRSRPRSLSDTASLPEILQFFDFYGKWDPFILRYNNSPNENFISLLQNGSSWVYDAEKCHYFMYTLNILWTIQFQSSSQEWTISKDTVSKQGWKNLLLSIPEKVKRC
jgi:hypothetical protein